MTDRASTSLAFCLFRYFPYGGLQRDMLRIALACQERGYTIEIYTSKWVGDLPDDLVLHTQRPAGLTNHGRMRGYSTWLTHQLACRRDVTCVVGFNKMPGLDVYFAADGCYRKEVRRKHPLFSRMTGRYRTYAEFEKAVFSPASQTEIMLIAEPQRAAFQEYYETPSERLHLLSPWISADRKVPEDRDATRRAIRATLGIAAEDYLLLQVGSDFKRKAVDRTLRGLASLPAALQAKTKLAVAGLASSYRYRRLAASLGVVERVLFLGPRDDVMELMTASDLLMHPARSEPAGVVLIEAMACGLPILCSAACGHAGHIRTAQAGCVLSEPFEQTQLDDSLLNMLTPERLRVCGARAQAYVEGLDLYGMPERAADIIESVVKRRRESP